MGGGKCKRVKRKNEKSHGRVGAASKKKEAAPRKNNNTKSLSKVPKANGAAAPKTTFLLHTMKLINGIERDKFHSSLFPRCCCKSHFLFLSGRLRFKKKVCRRTKSLSACVCVHKEMEEFIYILRACVIPEVRYCFARTIPAKCINSLNALYSFVLW
jgi:hypothetical protein